MALENPRILVATPTHSVMKYCFRRFIDSLKNLDYLSYDILMVDNSKENDFFEEMKEEGITVIKYDSDEQVNLKRLVASRNLILDFAKENGYDSVLMMDADVIPPNNIIQELLKQDKDIISGLYENIFVVNEENKRLPVAWLPLTEEEFLEIKKNYSLPDVVKTRFDIRRYMTPEEANSNRVIEVLYPSAGCMLISKAVFSVCQYGLLEMPNGIQTSDDVYFMEEARKKGFKIYVDTSVKCEHLFEGKFEKDEEGNLLHPVYKK
jgi:GT2 family glycosyltransferase